MEKLSGIFVFLFKFSIVAPTIPPTTDNHPIDGINPYQPQGWENWASRESDQRRAKVPGCVDGLGWGIFPA